MKKHIALITGGTQSEAIVSLQSAKNVQNYIDPEKFNCHILHFEKDRWYYKSVDQTEHPIDKSDFSFQVKGKKIIPDYAYIIIHGSPGEDGKLQGYLDMIGIPYSSCGVLASALTFNKFACNQYLKHFGVKSADSILIRKGQEFNPEDVVKTLGLPVFVKPNAGGSSFGISKVKKTEHLNDAVMKALEEDNEVVIEEFIEGLELTNGAFKLKNNIQSLPVTEVISPNDFFDYHAKYTPGVATEITPARIPNETAKRIQDLSSFIYQILNLKGIVRIDYILKENTIYLLEVNTIPGMTGTSFIPQQIEAAGLNMKEVITEIIEEGI